MEIAGTLINAAVVSVVGALVVWQLQGRFGALERRVDRLEDRFEQRMDRSDQRVEGLQASIDAMRSDLTQVALAVGARPRAGEA